MSDEGGLIDTVTDWLFGEDDPEQAVKDRLREEGFGGDIDAAAEVIAQEIDSGSLINGAFDTAMQAMFGVFGDIFAEAIAASITSAEIEKLFDAEKAYIELLMSAMSSSSYSESFDSGSGSDIFSDS